jgi:hypothetical protein
MLARLSLARNQRATRASVGMPSPAYAGECQLPASSRDSSPRPSAATRPRPSVVRSSIGSCIRISAPSADSFTSNSNIV